MRDKQQNKKVDVIWFGDIIMNRERENKKNRIFKCDDNKQCDPASSIHQLPLQRKITGNIRMNWRIYGEGIGRRLSFPDQQLNSTMAAVTVQKPSRPIILSIPRFPQEKESVIQIFMMYKASNINACVS